MYRLSENKRDGNNQEGQCTVYTRKHSYWLTAKIFILLFFIVIIIIIATLIFVYYHLNHYQSCHCRKKRNYIFRILWKTENMNILYF